ncbi:MAG: GDYXXLXY domain-containing protein [Deltaproteobacteria bacterium]|jgi:uncharacterized membrane protein/uncharacterized membrane-anchored protein|nr:GDYXXLXY domain-containing protein [Deltaproteobacteria bacterium]
MPEKRFIWEAEAGAGYKFSAKHDIRRRLKQLFTAGHLDAAQYSSGLDYFDIRPDAPDWRVFFGRVLGLAGALFFLAGVIMFLAWNWQDFPKFLKFGIFEAIFAGCGLLAFWRWQYGMNRTDHANTASLAVQADGANQAGQADPADQIGHMSNAALLCAGISLGALLALHGQIYQTGANSWELFRGWFLLLLPLFLLARNTGLGLLLWITGSLCLLLRRYLFDSDFSLDPFDGLSGSFYGVDALLLGQLAAWLLCEAFFQIRRQRATARLAGLFASFDSLRWLTRLTATAFMLLISCKVTLLILEAGSYYYHNAQPQSFGLSTALLYLAALIGIFVFYYRKFPDLFMLALAVFSLAWHIGVYLIKALLSDLGGSDGFSALLLAGLILIALCLGAAKAIFELRKGMLARQATTSEAGKLPSLRNLAVWRDAGARALRDWLLTNTMSGEEITDFLTKDEAKQETTQPWYVKVPMAIGIWLGSLLIFGFMLLTIFDDLDYDKYGMLVIGLCFCAGGVVMFRKPSFAMRQFGLVLLFCGLMSSAVPVVEHGVQSGTFLFAAALFGCFWRLLPYDGPRVICFAAALASLYMLLLYLYGSYFGADYYSSYYQGNELLPEPLSSTTLIFQILAALFPAAVCAFCLTRLGSMPSLAAAKSANPNSIHIQSADPKNAGSQNENPNNKQSFALFESAAGGGLLFLLTMSLTLLDFDLFVMRQTFFVFVKPGLALGFLAGFILLARRQPERKKILLALGLVLALLAWLSASAALGLTLLLLARNRSDIVLSGFAAAYLGLAVVMLYYNLNMSFLWKAFCLTASGALLAAFALAAQHIWSVADKTNKAETARAIPAAINISLRNSLLSGRYALLLILICILCGFNYSVADKEALLRNGQIMLLELAPVDPLSLLQGYYMELDLRAEREIAANIDMLSSLSEKDYEWQKNGQGLAVMREIDGKSEFARLYEPGAPLAEDEKLLAFKVLSQPDSNRWRQTRVRISGGSFFFEEGQAKTYDQARFALLRVGLGGESLIADLCDAKGNVIKPIRQSE